MYEQKEGFGNLFSNTKTKDTQPDMKGEIMLDGKLYEVVGWARTDKNGKKFLSLKGQEKVAVKAGDMQQNQDDDPKLPF